MSKLFLAGLILLTACAPALSTQLPAPTPQVVKVAVSAAAQPWLPEVYGCAQASQIIIAQVNDPDQADIAIRFGEPENLGMLAYQIDKDELLVVTGHESPLQNRSMPEIRALFADPPQDVQIWVFAPGEDLQQIFMQEIMQGAQVSSQAHIALSPQQMSDRLNREQNAVGILPRRWKAGTVRDVFSLPGMPVLALTQSEPQGAVETLLACLQK